MNVINHQKLVRDKIISIIEADGERPFTRVLDDAEYRRRLLEKLVEEAKELLDSDGDLNERADVAEVLMALDASLGFDTEAVERARLEKFQKRGGFEQKIFLEMVENDD